MTLFDKALHAAVGLGATGILTLFLHFNPFLTLGIVFALAVIKELNDRRNGKKFDWWDVAATIIFPLILSIYSLWQILSLAAL